MWYRMHAFGRSAVALLVGATLVLALAAPAAAAKPARPFLGTASGTSSIVPILQPISACPAGSMFFVTENGTGNFAHLGRVHITLHQCAAANMATGEGWTTTNGSIEIVAANGDRLQLSHSMAFQADFTGTPKTAVAHLDWVVVGGTGRFANATGSGESSWSVVYTPDLSGATSFSTWTGTIAY